MADIYQMLIKYFGIDKGEELYQLGDVGYIFDELFPHLNFLRDAISGIISRYTDYELIYFYFIIDYDIPKEYHKEFFHYIRNYKIGGFTNKIPNFFSYYRKSISS